MHYHFQFSNRSSRYAHVTVHIDGIDADSIAVRLPAWRPGRYELGNFAKNIRQFKAYGKDGIEITWKKSANHTWQIDTRGCDTVRISYYYYCAQPDAGACWIDEELVYINPVHCCMYVEDRLHEPCTVQLDLPADYRIACSLTADVHGILQAADFHELVDSPWMAAREFHHVSYAAHGSKFEVWLHGSCEPDLEKIASDFKVFSVEQIETMGGLPVDTYHFLVLVLPYRFYHGVEHLKSTVLALGPGHELMSQALYDDLTGVASHELFHVWNVKFIRPADLLPYDYSSENHSRLGYVYEGVTTYYGDLFLVRSGVYAVQQYFTEIDLRLKKHFDSFGRLHLSVADSSFDTWLDGYVPGAPHRKTSIYDEGCLLALMTDLFIRRNTNGRNSLDDVMRILYNDFGKKGIGYSEKDYRSIVEQVAGTSMREFFESLVYGVGDFEAPLRELLEHVGCKLDRKPTSLLHERRFGFRAVKENGQYKVVSVLPGSPADSAGLAKDDEVVAVNGEQVAEDLSTYFQQRGEVLSVTVQTPMRRLRELTLKEDGGNYFSSYHVARLESASEEQKSAFKAWTKQAW